ncbi:MAG: alpha/beta hydrolase, partial [Alphaproteobacteria bacterium]|nr:alpha/beta hydrolase [Alphaproteobacteria bacterium]
MKRFIAACIITYIIIVGLFYWKQRDLMYPPEAHTFSSEIADAPDMQLVEITTEDGLVLKSWYKKADDGQPTFLAFHGNGGTIWHLIPQARKITGEGYGLLLAEYRYYGGNEGTPSEEGLYKDAEAHFAWLTQNNIKDIIIYGQSLGSGPAVHLATQVEAKALILEVPFSSALDVAAHKFPFLPFPSIIMHDQ